MVALNFTAQPIDSRPMPWDRAPEADSTEPPPAPAPWLKSSESANQASVESVETPSLPNAAETFDPDQLRTEIPMAMQQARRWLLWQYEEPEKPGGKPRKVPYYTTGQKRRGILDTEADLSRLVTMEEALSATERLSGYGLGFALGPDGNDSHWQGIDLDGITKRPEVAALVERLPGYVERSPSGEGVHAVGIGACYRVLGSNDTGIEAYSAGRYFTVTADAIGGDIEDISGFVGQVLAPMHHREPSANEPGTTEAREHVTPAQVGELRSALFAMRADDRDLWVRMGLALHGLGNTGRELWMTWSATSEKFEPSVAARTWDSMRPERTGYAAVFAEAKRHGWINPAAKAEQISAEDIPDPMPLPRLPAVPEFPLDLLPDDLRPWVEDAADRARFRPDFAATASMCALGSAIGRKIGIRLKQRDDWTEYANVWSALVGPPSALKSPALREALRALKTLQIAADEANKRESEAYAIELEAHKIRKENRKKAATKALAKDPDADVDLSAEPPPDKPVARTYWTSDATAERLGELLAENPNGLLIERDELSSLLTSLEDERYATARGLYLSGWSGKEGYRFDRIMRGTTVLPKFALSIVGGIQPGPLARYVRSAYSGERADGLLQRFQLIVWPDPQTFEYVDRHPLASAKEAALELFKRADTLDPGAIGKRDAYAKDDDPPFVRLDPEAQALFSDWYTSFMRERREAEMTAAESAPVSAHFGKYPGLLAKLALILHIADEPQADAVSRRTLLKALGWIEYLTPHAMRVYHAIESPETTAGELLLARLRQGALPPKFKPRDIYRKGWHGLSDREAVRAACRLLEDYGWLIEVPIEQAKGGRPADPTYSVSPKVEVQP